MNLRPGQNETRLPGRQLPADQFYRVDSEDAHLVLVVRV